MSQQTNAKQTMSRFTPARELYKRTLGGWYWRRLRKSLKKYDAQHPSEDLLLIYSSGQVGSSAIEEALLADPEFTQQDAIHHLHYLNPQSIRRAEPYSRWYLKEHDHILQQQLKSLYITRRLNAGQDLSRVRVITAVRNPLRTLVAGFFQTLYRLPNFDMQRFENPDDSDLLDELQALFLKTRDIDYYLHWFDREIYSVFGIDIYSKPFPHGAGYQIFADQHPQLLLLKTEQLSEAMPPAMGEFLGLENFRMTHGNVAAEKPYAAYYERFLETARIPKEWVTRAERSRLLQHFYTEEERQTILAPWRQN